MDKKAKKTYLGIVTFKEGISDSYVDLMATPFLLMDSCSQ